jgi:excisionase family DNA binding protein
LAEEPLLSISEASQLLGVSEAALRHWTGEGKIKAFITPGGHRRYARTGLKKFMNSNPKALRVKDLVAELAETAPQHREIALASPKETAWYGRLSKKAQGQLADLGRRMLNLIIKYVTEPSRREKTLQLIREVGRDHGEALAKMEMPLTDSVESFLRHRDPIMHAATHLMKKREGFTGRVVESIPMVGYVMDEALVALVAAHQQHRGEAETNGSGGAPR